MKPNLPFAKNGSNTLFARSICRKYTAFRILQLESEARFRYRSAVSLSLKNKPAEPIIVIPALLYLSYCRLRLSDLTCSESSKNRRKGRIAGASSIFPVSSPKAFFTYSPPNLGGSLSFVMPAVSRANEFTYRVCILWVITAIGLYGEISSNSARESPNKSSYKTGS